MSTSDPRHYDVILSPVITEKATLASEHNQVMFKVAAQRDQAADQGSGGEALRRQGQERQHPRPQRQGQGLQGHGRPAVADQARDRDPRRGSPHRRDDGPVRSGTMALKTYNPVTPSQRQLVLVDRSGLHRGAPVKTLTEGKNSSGGRNNNGRITVRFRGGGHKQAYRKIDFKRRKFDVPANGRAHRIRSQPHRLHRADQVPGRRARLHPGAAAARRRATRVVAGEHVDVKPGNAMPARQHPDRHHRAQYRDQDRQGRADRALGRHLCADRRPRRRLRHPAAQFGRAAPGARPLHGDDRGGVEPRQHEHLDRQGRPQALDGPHAAQSRRRR